MPMNRNILGLGVVILIIGILVVAISVMPVKTTEQVQVAYVENSWTLSCTLQVGDDIFIVVRPGPYWGNMFEGSDYELPVNVTVTAPDEGEALFQLMYKQWPEPPQYEGGSYSAYASRLVLVKADNDSLATTQPLNNVGGIVGQNGTYTVQVGMDWSDEPPSEISFQKTVVKYEHPYTSYLPAGGVTSVFGVAVSVYCVFPKRRKPLRKATHAR